MNISREEIEQIIKDISNNIKIPSLSLERSLDDPRVKQYFSLIDLLDASLNLKDGSVINTLQLSLAISKILEIPTNNILVDALTCALLTEKNKHKNGNQ